MSLSLKTSKQRNMRIAFVILHYIITKETCDAISHIKQNVDTDEYMIIVVDNASPNNSYSELSSLYANDSNVILIKTETNLGFARGNNVGLRYAEKNYHPDYIVMLNNDVNLVEKELLRKLDQEYAESRFAVAGPHIELGNGDKTTNPFKLFIPTLQWINYMIQKRSEEMFWA